jgi:hypothetical protein
MASHGADRMLKALEPLVGQWSIVLRGPDGELWPGQGQASFMWHESGAHLVQRTTIDVPDVPDSSAIIGCDETNETFSQLYGDERGVRRIYSMTLKDRIWTLEREGDPFPQRFAATISEDGQTIDGAWEKAEDGTNFKLDFHLTYRRINSSGSSAR